MNRPIVAKIRAVRRRLMLVQAIRRALVIFYWLTTALCILVVVGRFKLPVPTLIEAAPWVAGAGALWLIAWLIARRVSLFESAVCADEALGLKERLSTAMLISNPQSLPEQAVLEDALIHARAVRPSAVARFEFRRQLGFAGGSLAVLALLFFFMPTIDPFAKQKEEKRMAIERVEAQREKAKQIEEILKETTTPPELAKPESINNADREMKALAKALEEQKVTPEQAQAKMEKIGDRIKNRREEIQKQLSDASTLNSRGEGRVTQEVSKELAQGNFEEAAKKLEAVQEKLQQGKLSEQEKSALAQEMKGLASKMGQNPEMAQALNQAAEQISQGNTNAALAGMQDAAKSMQQMQSLFNEMQALDKMQYDMKGRQMAMAQSQQQQQAGQCPNCGGQLDSNGQCQSCGFKGQGKGQGQGQGSDGEKKGMSAGATGERSGQWQQGDTSKRGQGLGGPGKGRGGEAGTTDGQVSFETKRIKGDLTPGEIIARFKVEGTQNPGEITTKYEGLALERAQQSEDSIEHEAMPLEFKSLVRDYFAAIKRDQAKPASQTPAASGSPAAQPPPAGAPGAAPEHPPAP